MQARRRSQGTQSARSTNAPNWPIKTKKPGRQVPHSGCCTALCPGQFSDKVRRYSSSTKRRGSFLCFSVRSSRRRLSSNFLDGMIGARSRGRNFSFSIISFFCFFATPEIIDHQQASVQFCRPAMLYHYETQARSSCLITDSVRGDRGVARASACGCRQRQARWHSAG